MTDGANPGTAAWLRLMKAYNMILREARGSVGPDCTLAQFDVLAQLLREDKGLPAAELSRRLLVTAGNITGLVDRMERLGWVRRAQDPEDRRVARVQLTDAGRKKAAALVPRHSADLEEMFTILNLREKKQLRELLDKLIHGLENNTGSRALER